MSYEKYIKISLYGQFEGELRTALRYPEPREGEPEGKYVVFNPTKVLDQFISARECYALWSTPEGEYYGMVTRNPLDPNSGAMLLSLQVAHGVVLSGRQVISALSHLRRTIVEEGNADTASIENALRTAGIPSEPVIVPALAAREKQEQLPVDQQPKGTAYRTFVSGHELDSILSFPYQEEYRKYRRVLIVSATAALRPEARITRITTPMQRRYWVCAPTGVATDVQSINEGDRLNITFSKPGYSSCKETLTAGIASPYIKYDGALIKIKSPGESGLTFTRRVKVTVSSSKGQPLHGYTINVNGRPVNTMEPYIELTEHDMTSGHPVQINVASSNYRSVKMEKDPAELSRTEQLDIVLEPLEQGILLRLDFGEGRLFEQTISLERNTPEYSQLHSGNFHGFRAYRISSQGMNEAYNIDVRSSAKPVSPSFDRDTVTAAAPVTTTTQSTTAASAGRKIPVFENISREDPHKPHHHHHGDTDKKADEKMADEKKKDEKKTLKPRTSTVSLLDDPEDDSRGGNKLGIIVCVVVSLILLVLAVVYFLPSSIDDNDEDAEMTEQVVPGDYVPPIETADSPAPAAAADTQAAAPAAAAPSADEDADIKYLNENKVWRLADIKSEKYRALYNAIANGDIEAMAKNDYFSVKGRSTNFHANEVIDMAWKALGTDNEGGNRKALQKLKDAQSIDMHALYEDLAKRKPKTPNTNPRPGQQ